MKIKIKIKRFVLLTICCILFLSSVGCTDTLKDSMETAKLSETMTSYTVDDLKSKALSKNHSLDKIKEEDCTDEAVYAYNQMLDYVDNELELDYKIYDFYYCSPELTGKTSYVIKIVLEQDVEGFEAEEEIKTGDLRILCLISDKYGRNIESTVVAYLMGHKWKDDVIKAMEEEFFQYHTNACFVQLYDDFNYISDNGYENIYDYNYYYDVDKYNASERVSYDNVVNIIAPVGTKEEEAEKIKDDVTPLLEKYCVTDICVMTPVDQETYERLIEEESDINQYWFSSDMEWFHEFSIKKSLS